MNELNVPKFDHRVFDYVSMNLLDTFRELSVEEDKQMILELK